MPHRLALALLLLLVACGQPPRSLADDIADLKSPDPAVRRRAVRVLDDHGAVPAVAVRPLIAAYGSETDRAAKGAELVALGSSGAAQAKPLIDDAVQKAADADERRWASRALRRYLIAQGTLSRDEQLPPGWPYGQPGYPAALRDEGAATAKPPATTAPVTSTAANPAVAPAAGAPPAAK